MYPGPLAGTNLTDFSEEWLNLDILAVMNEAREHIVKELDSIKVLSHLQIPTHIAHSQSVIAVYRSKTAYKTIHTRA